MNKLFRQCLSEIPQDQRRSFDLSYGIAEKLDSILKEKEITQHELAKRLHKRDSEISKWLTGRHNFTLNTISAIECALGTNIIKLAE